MAQLIMQMHESGLATQPVIVDCTLIDGAENPSLTAFKGAFLKRSPDRAKDVERFVQENIMAIQNKFQDTWFWGPDVFQTIG